MHVTLVFSTSAEGPTHDGGFAGMGLGERAGLPAS